jgi:hypothetical protein
MSERLVITLPQDETRVAQLRSKLEEYKQRLPKQKAENIYLPPEVMPASYAILILGTLLEKGQVDYSELYEGLVAKSSFMLAKPELLDQYWSVIEDYVLTGGKKNISKTGLISGSKE